MKRVEIDTTIDEYLLTHKTSVYSEILNSIKLVYTDLETKSVNVLEIDSHLNTLKLNLDKKDWITSLDRARLHFESTEIEEYEKCADCVKIINYLKNINKSENKNTFYIKDVVLDESY